MMQDQEQAVNDNNQQQEASDGAVRFPAWTALAVLSIVSWFALLGGNNNMDSSDKWALAVTTLSWILGVIGWLCYLYGRGMFMDQLPEVVLVRTEDNSTFLCGFIVACVFSFCFDSFVSSFTLRTYLLTRRAFYSPCGALGCPSL
jgi:hypothetical protein